MLKYQFSKIHGISAISNSLKTILFEEGYHGKKNFYTH